MAELDASGAVLRRFIPDGSTTEGSPAMDRRVVQVSSAGAVSWFHTDHQGSVIAPKTKVPDASGHATATASYSPYGEFATLGQIPPGGVFGYTGRQFDAETGLYQYRARYYHPRLGQFLSTDPIGTKDDPNLTLYVRLDPVNLTDPTGMCIGATIRICQEIARRAAPVIARSGNAVSRHLPGTTQHAAAAQQRLQAANLARHPAYQLVLNRGDQGKHIVGSRNYDPSGTRSILTANPQLMFDRLGGTGSSVNQVQRGSDRFRERVEANGIIGQYYDQATRAFVPTDRALIHYGRYGWHIVPARPSGNMMNLINEAVF